MRHVISRRMQFKRTSHILGVSTKIHGTLAYTLGLVENVGTNEIHSH